MLMAFMSVQPCTPGPDGEDKRRPRLQASGWHPAPRPSFLYLRASHTVPSAWRARLPDSHRPVPHCALIPTHGPPSGFLRPLDIKSTVSPALKALDPAFFCKAHVSTGHPYYMCSPSNFTTSSSLVWSASVRREYRVYNRGLPRPPPTDTHTVI